jgi:hypothetical protein
MCAARTGSGRANIPGATSPKAVGLGPSALSSISLHPVRERRAAIRGPRAVSFEMNAGLGPQATPSRRPLPRGYPRTRTMPLAVSAAHQIFADHIAGNTNLHEGFG